MKSRVLFVRVTEICNAKCFMCDFAGNLKGNVLSKEDYDALLEEIDGKNYKVIKFTGGEPLVNPNISYFISASKAKGYKTALITNGLLLSKKIDEIAQSGLDQLIVSLDGNTADLNDKLRGVKGIFKNATEGIKKCKELYPHIVVRVNTVASNLNIFELIDLAKFLNELHVDMWAITPLKDDYNCFEGNQEKYIEEYHRFIDYVSNNETPKLIGYSKYWGGRNEKEEKDLFSHNKHYTPNGVCHLVDHVSFYIPSRGLLLPCNSLSHRLHEVKDFLDLDQNMVDKADCMANWIKKEGQKKCSGCSPINVYLSEHENCLDEDIWSF